MKTCLYSQVKNVDLHATNLLSQDMGICPSDRVGLVQHFCKYSLFCCGFIFHTPDKYLRTFLYISRSRRDLLLKNIPLSLLLIKSCLYFLFCRILCILSRSSWSHTSIPEIYDILCLFLFNFNGVLILMQSVYQVKKILKLCVSSTFLTLSHEVVSPLFSIFLNILQFFFNM